MTDSLSNNCPICGKEKQTGTLELLGATITVLLSCKCELDQYEADMQRIREREQQERRRVMQSNSGLKGSAADMTLENFKSRPGTVVALNFIKEYLENWQENKQAGAGFALIGEYGNGKSHMAAAVVNELTSKQIPAIFSPITDLIKRIQASYNNNGESEGEILSLMQKAEFLVLDDIGTQRQTEWAKEMLFNLIDYRYRFKLPTAITTNCSAVDGEKSLTDALGGRIVDRLLERNTFIKVTASSYRRELAKERMK